MKFLGAWQPCGLCNGAVGKVVTDIVYDENCPLPGLPKCGLVVFEDDYTSETLCPPC